MQLARRTQARSAAHALTLGIALAGLAAACGDDTGSGGGGGAGGGAGGAAAQNAPTFHKDIEPILHASCLSCHLEGRIGGFSLEHYEDAKAQAGYIAAVTGNGIMPPWHAIETDACQPSLPFHGDPRLPQEQKDLLKAWADAGAPEGDPADAPPPYVPTAIGLESPDLELVPDLAGQVQGDSDLFECVVYDPALSAQRYLDGIHIIPGNERVAHHALMFRMKRADVTQISGGAERFDCFGAPGNDLIGAWAPGTQPQVLPSGVGMTFGADDVIVVQMHYHPTGTSLEEDRSTIQMHFATSTPAWEYQIALVGNAPSAPELLPDPDDRNGTPEFRIPADAKDHVESMRFVVPDTGGIEVPVLVVGTHMHYVGYDGRFWVERANPKASEKADECFVQTPAWDFNWQRGYRYEGDISVLPTVSTGDVLGVECRYNNSMSNPFVVDALKQQGMSAPADVVLGEQTLNEMCLGVLGYLLPIQ